MESDGYRCNPTVERPTKIGKLSKSVIKVEFKKKFGGSEIILKVKTKLLEKLQKFESPNNLVKIKEVKGEIDILLEQEDRRWKQRAKQNWYSQGDQNAKIFYAWQTITGK
jgi:hypothetical protein